MRHLKHFNQHVGEWFHWEIGVERDVERTLWVQESNLLTFTNFACNFKLGVEAIIEETIDIWPNHAYAKFEGQPSVAWKR